MGVQMSDNISQLMGATFSEPLLYRVGYALEEALGEICKEATL